MNHFHRANNNSSNNNNNNNNISYTEPVIETKPPRTTRSSIDTRTLNANIQPMSDSTHRRTNYVKSHSSPSPSTSNRHQNFNSSSTNSEFLNQSSHRVRQKSPKESSYMPQKRNDSNLSNYNSSNTRQSSKFLDSSESEPEDNKKKDNTKLFENKNGANIFLVNNQTDESVNSFAKCIFAVDGKSADCELDEYKISWRYISSSFDDMPGSRKNKKKTTGTQVYQIPYDRIFSVEPKRSKNSPLAMNFEQRFSLGDDFTIEGFMVHTFERQKPNIYQPRFITFTHPHRQTCKQWISQLYKLASSFLVEKRLIILSNPYSGERRTRSTLNFVVYPLLNLINFNTDLIEFHDDKVLRNSLYEANVNFNDYYGIIILSGDGCISNVIRDIVETQARIQDDGEFIDLNKVILKTPICIIPCGSTNLIANSVYGTSNHYTPLMHLIYGTYINIDITSIHTSDQKFFNFAFGYSCGFGADLVRYFDRYSKLGVKKVQASIAKGSTKRKRKPIEIEIKYIPSTSNQPCDKIRCCRNCELCELKEKNHQNGKTIDEVQEFDPLAVSINEIEDNLGYLYRKEQSEEYSEDWKTVSGSFMNIELLTNAMLWDITSGGLSKYGHLADGSMDLILCDHVPRKEFYRFVKRHTKKKNQLELPFVKAIRIKEAKIKIKNNTLTEDFNSPSMQSMNKNSNKHNRMNHFNSSSFTESPKKNRSSVNLNNDDFSESDTDNEIEDFINKNFGEKNDSDDNRYNNGGRLSSAGSRNNVNESIDLRDKRKGPLLYRIEKNGNELNERSELPTESKSKSTARSSSSVRNSLVKKSKSILNLFQSEEKRNRSSSSVNESKTEKLQKSNRFKSPFAWNIDWNLYPMPYLHIKCHKQYLPVFGCGVDDDGDIDDTLIKGCFP